MHDWYRSAVFYEVLVRVQRLDNNGSGDLNGLRKLTTCGSGWTALAPPFYDSPLRDGGYDIRDFRAVLPEFGTVETRRFSTNARPRRRVITDLVMNHTSDTHEWFQQSRMDPDGPYGDFTCGPTTPTPRARASSSDTEDSN